MIQLHIRPNNSIITLSIPGKSPVKTTAASNLYFWTAGELLCASLGSCIGRAISIYCQQHKIDVKIFQFIGITIEDYRIKVRLQVPTDATPELKIDLIDIIQGCEIARTYIKTDIEVSLFNNTIKTEDLLAEKASAGCCQ